jgi:hypothetical protein
MSLPAFNNTLGQIDLQQEADLADLQAKKPKKQVNRVQLNESTLLQPTKGLKKLYEITNTLKLSENPKKDLRSLLDLYKEWHFIVAPKFEFNYFIQKCQILGTKAPVRSYMGRLRDYHSGKITEDEFQNPITQAPDDDDNFEQVYETPEKLLNNLQKKNDESENQVNEKMPSPKILNYFDELEEDLPGYEEELQVLNDLQNEGQYEFGDEQEMEYLQQLALEGTGKRLEEKGNDMEQEKYLKER